MGKPLIPIEIYTDGSAKGIDYSNKFGGWAYLVSVDGTILRENSGYEQATTNQRMELLAALKALRDVYVTARKDNESVILYSDSAYLCNCYGQQWWVNWLKNGWVNSKQQPVANQDLWEKLIPFFQLPSLTITKVKGHSTSFFNNRVDELAQNEAENAKKEFYGRAYEHNK